MVRFGEPLTTVVLARIEAALGYDVSQLYYPPDSLLLLLDAPREAALGAAAVVLAVTDRAPVDAVVKAAAITRAATAAARPVPLGIDVAAAAEAASRLHTRRTTTASAAAAAPPQPLSMRVTLHPAAAAVHGVNWMALHARVAAAVTQHKSGGYVSAVAGAARTAAANTAAFAGALRVHNVSHLAFHDAALALATAQHDLVAFIEPVYPVVTTNVWGARSVQRYARAGRASGGVNTSSTASADTCANVNCAPMWQAGFTGTGQFISISDTGITPASCGLFDASHSVPVSASRTCGAASVPSDTGHAKVRAQWVGTAGDLVDAVGHGEHVATTALGGRVSDGVLGARAAGWSVTDFVTGAAPGARLVFVDAHTSGDFLDIPEPYDTCLLPHVYAAGARIHSGSWGADTDSYDDGARRLDDYLAKHPTMVAVFAAGNAGAPSSIISPALAKNCIAVAAGMPGTAPFLLAAGTSLLHPAAYYGDGVTADFSSRGGANSPVPWLKPDITGVGGFYVWSGVNRACTNSTANDVTGMAGTR